MTISRTVKTFIAAGGLDPSAGAGLAADLAAGWAFGVIGLPIATALTVQNSYKAAASHAVDPAIVTEQLEAVYEDYMPAILKTGLVGSEEIATELAEFARSRNLRLVVDPVIRASSGLALADAGAQAAIKNILAPGAFVLTPNIMEASALTSLDIESLADAVAAAQQLHEAGAANVLVTGGHLETGDEVIDTLYNENGVTTLKAPRLPSKVRGTGCALSAAIAARLALGDNAEAAITAGRAYVARVIEQAVQAGQGARQGLPG